MTKEKSALFICYDQPGCLNPMIVDCICVILAFDCPYRSLLLVDRHQFQVWVL